MYILNCSEACMFSEMLNIPVLRVGFCFCLFFHLWILLVQKGTTEPEVCFHQDIEVGQLSVTV